MNAQLKKGILELCILHIIVSNELIYGYDLIKRMHIYFPEVNESTFYSILRRLYKSNLTEIVLKDVSGGPQRKYYKIKPEGRTWLNSNIDEWRELVKITNDLGINETKK